MGQEADSGWSLRRTKMARASGPCVHGERHDGIGFFNWQILKYGRVRWRGRWWWFWGCGRWMQDV